MANGKEILQAEIVSAVLSGKHHVEAAKLGLSGDQAYDVGVVEVRLDGTALDGQESFYRTKPSKKAEKFYSSDKNREARQAIRTVRRDRRISGGKSPDALPQQQQKR